MSCLERGSVISKAPSMKSLHHTSSSSTTKNEYVGLCLPVDVTLIFHVSRYEVYFSHDQDIKTIHQV